MKSQTRKLALAAIIATIVVAGCHFTQQPLPTDAGSSCATALTSTEFNNLTTEDLQSRTYTTVPIEMNDFSGTLVVGYSIAMKTSLGRLAKIRIAQIVSTSTTKDLALQVYVYR